MTKNNKEVQLDISFASRLIALKKPWHAPPGVHCLMIVLELFAGPDRDFCWPSLKLLAGIMDVSERQVRRIIAKAVEAELLIEIVETRDGRKTRRFKIRQANMIDLARRIEQEKPERPRRRKRKRSTKPDNVSQNSDTLSEVCDNVSHASDTLSRISDTLSDGCDNVSQPHCLYEFESTKKVQKESSPPPSQPGWKEVEGVVSNLVGNWEPALAAARSRGCSPAHVLAIVAEAERRRSGWSEDKFAGRLYRALLNAHPERSPGMGWPGPDSFAKARQEAATSSAEWNQKRAADAAAEAESQRQREAQAAKDAALDAEFGCELDALSPAEQFTLARSALAATPILWAGFVKKAENRDLTHPDNRLLRRYVLTHLASREEVAHGTT